MSKKHRTETATKTANTLSTARELYWDALGQEALQRNGASPQLKGIIHEMAFRDKLNLNPANILAGNVSKLTKHPQAHGVDVVTLNRHGRPVARYQVKDCTSPAGVDKTLGQTRNGQYHSSKLMGTEETTEAFNAKRLQGDKRMESTGISSKRTTRVADNAGANPPDSTLLTSNLKDIGNCAAGSAALGTAFGAVGAVVSGFDRYRDGEISGAEYAAEVSVEACKAGVSAGATTAGALAIKEAGKAAGRSLGSETLRRVAGSNVGTSVAFGLVEVGCDAVKLAQGDMDGQEFAKKTASTACGTAGGLGGAELGAALGTLLLPGVGTAIGAGIGGLLGGFGGRAIGDFFGSLFD